MVRFEPVKSVYIHQSYRFSSGWYGPFKLTDSEPVSSLYGVGSVCSFPHLLGKWAILTPHTEQWWCVVTVDDRVIGWLNQFLGVFR